MTGERFPLDPEISAMCDESAQWPAMAAADYWAALTATTGVSRETYFANLAHMLLMAGIREISGYVASARRHRGVRYNAYCEGSVEPPCRETRADRIRRDDIAFGLIEGAS